jgi:hypothetical protein
MGPNASRNQHIEQSIQPHTITPIATEYISKWTQYSSNPSNSRKPLHKCSYDGWTGIYNSDNSVTFNGITFETIIDAIYYKEIISFHENMKKNDVMKYANK